MSFFSALESSFDSSLSSALNGSVSTAAQRAVAKVTSKGQAALNGAVLGSGTKELTKAKAISQMAMRIKYVQGWQWNIEIDGFPGLDMYVKDITYGFGNIETESTLIGSVEFNKPTHATAGPLTVTVRDNESRDIRNMFMARKAMVTNPDGTLNLPAQYLLNARIYSVSQDGDQTLMESVQVFPTQFGECSFARDQVSEFVYYPLTFICYSSASTNLGASITSALEGAVSGSVSSIASAATSKALSAVGL